MLVKADLVYLLLVSYPFAVQAEAAPRADGQSYMAENSYPL